LPGEAQEPKWREAVRTVEADMSTTEYSSWDTAELDIRVFLLSSSHVMNDWFNARWAAASEDAPRIFDPEYYDVSFLYDLFVDYSGIDPESYWWQLSSAVVKDACGLYEIYLERSADEVVRRHGATLRTMRTEESWNWKACRAFYQAYTGIEVKPSSIEHIVWMRNKMAHLRDDLRTSEGLDEFDRRLRDMEISAPATTEEQVLGLSNALPAWSSGGVRVSQLQAYRILDIIRSHVNDMTVQLFSFVHGTASTKYLDALGSGRPIATGNFSAKKWLKY
jgi:hypothetical protein